MLVLSRKPGEKVVIGGGITVTVVSVKGNKVRLAFTAPGSCSWTGRSVAIAFWNHARLSAGFPLTPIRLPRLQ